MSDFTAAIYPSDQNMCGLIRMSWIGKALADQRHMATVMPRNPQIVVNTKTNPPQVIGISVGNYDVIVMQRAASYQTPQAINILQEQGKTVILDIDDDLGNIHPRNPAYKAYAPHVSRLTNWMYADQAYAKADLVTCTTQALADKYGSHGRVAVLPNYIPQSYLEVERPENEIPVVGWAGYTQSHPEDLYVTSGMINQALIDGNGSFRAIGDMEIWRQLQIRYREPHSYAGFVPVGEYPQELAKLDIGLVPLKDSPFNHAKSWLKALEYASLGVVPVVTPTPDNQRLIDMGAAIPAATPKEWYDRTLELLRDTEYRIEMSKKCREIAADLTIEKNVHQWWTAWGGAYENRKAIGSHLY